MLSKVDLINFHWWLGGRSAGATENKAVSASNQVAFKVEVEAELGNFQKMIFHILNYN